MADPALVCGWARNSEIEHLYHDHEWGKLQLDDAKLYEFIVLESAQAGLSWRTVLNKREGYRQHYLNFDPEKVAQFGESEIQSMLDDPAVIRNRAKIEASIGNARVFLQIVHEYGSFAAYLFSFMRGHIQLNSWQTTAEIPADTELSKAIAKDLKQRGMRFFGSTIVYAFLQACGFVNDHIQNCPEHSKAVAIAREAGYLELS
ncbi:MAG TPA: DNA-3-methyladenine glycosylase I [Marinobacterium sp.]|nr:DNA-3-methyladenine glycosylase I [Marinobacterium sp.]